MKRLRRVATMTAAVLILAGAVSTITLAQTDGADGAATAATAPDATIPVHFLATGSTLPDIVKLGNIVVDEDRRRAYFTASLSRYIGVIDADSLQMIDTIDSQVDGFVSRHLFLNSSTGILYVHVADTNQLFRIDPVSGSVSSPVEARGAAAIDAGTGRVYIGAPPSEIEVYDGSLQSVGTISDVTAVGRMFVDSTLGRLYVVNSVAGPPAGVSVYDTSTLQFIEQYSMPSGFDGLPIGVHANYGKVYVTGVGSGTQKTLSIIDESTGAGTLISLSETGAEMHTYQDRLYLMTGYPYHAGYLPSTDGSYGIIEVRDALTGAKEKDLWADLQSLYFDIDETTGSLFYAATGRSTIGVVRLSDYTTLTSIDIATTIEDVLVHPSDGSLYLRNRLGGSTIYRVDPDAGTLTNTLDPGNWPTKILLDASRNHLYALSHYEAKISVFDLSSDALVDTIALGTQPARTDALSTMAMDRSLGKLYVVMPELGTLTAVNADGSGSPLTISIDGFDPSQSTSPGALHIAVNESLGRVFVFMPDTKRLSIYDASTLALLSYSTISDFSLLAPPLDLLFSDDEGGRLFVGPHIVDPITGAVTGSVPTGQKVIGMDRPADRIYVWDIIAPDSFERIYEYDLNLSGVINQWDLSPILGVYSAFNFDFGRGKMYAGYLAQGVLDVLDLGAPVAVGGIAELPEEAGAPLQAGSSSGSSAGVLASIAAAATSGLVVLGGAAWYARRRRLWRWPLLFLLVLLIPMVVGTAEAQEGPSLPYESSPFGFHPASIGGLASLSFIEAQDISIRWHRPPVYAFWFLAQPDLGSPIYDWSLYDAQYGAVPAGINILANITVGPESAGYSLPGSYLPIDTAAYQDFVRATVERYDGDRVDDMPGLVVPIRYWQVDNEPGFGGEIGRTDFAQLQAQTYTAIKDACPDCRVLIGGATGFPNNFVDNFLTDYALILAELNGQYVDIFDFHWYGNATGDYRLLGQALSVIQTKLQETGFGGIPIWVTEMGTYSGDPLGPFGYQSEEQQAADLLKRFVHPISLGIEKVFPAFGLIEGFRGDDGYFDHTGLIYDGQGSDDRGYGVKKIGYYTYKLMTEKLEGATFEYELTGLPADVYGYAFTGAGGDPITILWYDDFAGGPPTQDVTLTVAGTSALVTDAVTDQDGNITSMEVPTVDGAVTLTLGQSPVFVEPAAFITEEIETWVTAPNGNQLYTRIVQPDPALYPGERFPALIAIPGGTGAGAPLADNFLYRGLAASGFVVVAFNPEGRGTGLPGNLISQGTEDCNGFVHQDDLKAVIEFLAGLPNVDAGNIGVQTSSFGIAIGAGALGRHPSLPVAYLVDAEGPHDNLVITFYDAGRETAVCDHLSTVTDPSPENQDFWAEREAVRYIGSYPGRYLRMQAEIDHAQDPGYFRHAIEMIEAATRPEYGGSGSTAWTRMNGSDLGNPINTVYPLGDPGQHPAWVSGRLSGHPGLEITYIREMAALSAGPVGGVAELPEPAGAPLDTARSSGRSYGIAAALAAAGVVSVAALSGAAWYARRRWVRR